MEDPFSAGVAEETVREVLAYIEKLKKRRVRERYAGRAEIAGGNANQVHVPACRARTATYAAAIASPRRGTFHGARMLMPLAVGKRRARFSDGRSGSRKHLEVDSSAASR